MLKKMYDLQKKKGKKGFSMIELIIVIAIMAILIALIGTQLLPYLEKSREKRDLTTLDTILTATQSVISENELTDSVVDGNSVATVLGSDENVKKAFESYSGLKLTEKPFKSKKAGTDSKVEDAKLIVTGTGESAVITGIKIGTEDKDHEPLIATRNSKTTDK